MIKSTENKKTHKKIHKTTHPHKNHKYTYLIKQEFLNDKIPLTETPKIDVFQKEFEKTVGSVASKVEGLANEITCYKCKIKFRKQ